MRQIGRKCFVGLMLVCLSFSLVWAPVANAQAGIVAGRMSVAISEMTIAKAARWGFAANDPRVTATRAGISGGLYVLAGGAGLVSWPALLVAAGVSAVVVGGIALAKDGKFTWTFGSDKSVTSGGIVPSVQNYYGGAIAPMVVGQRAFTGNVASGDYPNYVYYPVYGSKAEAIAQAMSSGFNGAAGPTTCSPSNSFQWVCNVDLGYKQWNAYVTVIQSVSADIVAGQNSSGFNDGRPPPPNTQIQPILYTKPDDAVKAIPAAVASLGMSPELLAASVNAAWKSAVAPTVSGGLPWSASDPVTPDEASAWMAANPSMVPTVGDWGSSATVTTGGQVVIPVGSTYSTGNGASASLPTGMPAGGNPAGGSSSGTPTSGTGTGTGTGTATSPTTSAPTTGSDPTADPLNLGPIPNIGAPSLEDTPTAAAVLDPGFSLMPDLKNFAVPAHAGVCPTASFALYGKAYVMDAHCGLLEQNRSVIGALMVVVFTLAATYTVLRA